MRRFFTLLVLSVLSFTMYAQNGGVKWEEGSFTQVLEKAKKLKKPIFLDCYTSWCGPCKQMANNVFPLPKAGEFFNANFVNVKIDMEKGEGIELKTKYDVKAFPTFIIIDSNGEEINRVVGGGDLDKFIAQVKIAMSPDKSPLALKQKFESSKNPEDAIAYMALLKESYMEEKIVEFIEANFNNFGRALHSSEMWKFISVALVSDSVYEKVMGDKYEFDENLSKGEVNKALSGVLYNKLVAYLTGKVTLTPEQVVSVAKDLAFCMEGRNLMLARVVSNVAVAYSKNDKAAIDKALNLNFLRQRLTGHERFMLNAFVLQKGIFLTPSEKEEFNNKLK